MMMDRGIEVRNNLSLKSSPIKSNSGISYNEKRNYINISDKKFTKKRSSQSIDKKQTFDHPYRTSIDMHGE